MDAPVSARSPLAPVLFVGHGSPMHAIEDNAWSRAFSQLRQYTGTPKAILAVSAHWYGPGTMLTAQETPPTIHDFGGFPQALYEVQYPAPGSPSLAARVRTLLGDDRVKLSQDWGLDHGTWSVLKYAFPEASVPVIQLSIDARLTPEQHLDLARNLRELREDGIMIFGTGNITHNLRAAFAQMRTGSQAVPDWSSKFDAEIVRAIEQRDAKHLAAILNTDHGRLSHPTPDHYVPLLYTFGASDPGDTVRYPVEGFDIGLSMRAVLWT